MANNQQQQKSILDTAVNIDPVAVVYNIENDAVENFAFNYLSSIKGIKGVAATRLNVIRDGNRNPQLSLYAFFDQRSEDIFSQVQNVPEHLRRKLDIGGFRASKKLHDALLPVVRDYKLVSDGREKLVFVRLDVFKVLGLMLASDHRRHNLVISEVIKLKKNRSVFTAIKSAKHVDKGGDNEFDRFTNIIERNQR
jgi:hypothetical protein